VILIPGEGQAGLDRSWVKSHFGRHVWSYFEAGIKCIRDFEVPVSGSFYMVEYMEELEEFFNIGKEILRYTDKEDLADKIKCYLGHDDERERIRRVGHQRCLRDHSWHKRFQKAFRGMGLA
jgi:spore maturation protein CgeB